MRNSRGQFVAGYTGIRKGVKLLPHQGFQKGNTLGSKNKGHPFYPITDAATLAERNRKISEANSGKIASLATRQKQSIAARARGYCRQIKSRPVPCTQCGKVTRKYPRDIARVHQSFCSKQCAYKFRDHGKTTEAMRIRDSKEYVAWRKHVFNRDDFTCQSCAKRGGKLVADHELSFANFPSLRFEILNGRTLCTQCHFKTPNYGTRATLDRTL